MERCDERPSTGEYRREACQTEVRVDNVIAAGLERGSDSAHCSQIFETRLPTVKVDDVDIEPTGAKVTDLLLDEDTRGRVLSRRPHISQHQDVELATLHAQAPCVRRQPPDRERRRIR